MYNVYITKIKNLRKHPNADRLLCGECFGNTVIVSLDYVDDQLGVYLPVDGQLSQEFAEANNLVRRKDEHGNNVGGYMDPDKRNVSAIRLRGERSDGLFLPLTCLSKFGDISKLNDGDIVTVFNGHEIAQKYIPKANTEATTAGGAGARVGRRARRSLCSTFFEHKDTEQLAYNLNAFKSGDQIEITLKMHGTSQRTGYLKKLTGFKRTLWDKIFKREGTPLYDYGYVTGTRRTVLGESVGAGYYGTLNFREKQAARFEGKLMKGETIYYEVVGFTDNGTSIMGECGNKKLNDPEFVKQYGETTVFSYGCDRTGDKAPQNEIYVYRMTMTNEDGFVVDYTPDFMRYRCEQMGIKTVPELWRGTIPQYGVLPQAKIEGEVDWIPGDWAMMYANMLCDGADPIGKTHVREGVVVRIINRPTFAAYKHKNFSFKVLSGIAIAQAAEDGTLDNMSADEISEL